MAAPLSGLRVLDFSRVLSGPYASMTLADLGADVVKVEEPGSGDDTRAFGPPYADGVSTYFLSINRGKRSISLDLKKAEDRATALALADQADVVLENFRPGVMARLGLGPDTLRARNPRLIYCAISGFGADEPGAPGYDLVVQGLSGIPSLTGPADQPPAKCGASVADLVAGLNAVSGVLAALYRRERTGQGAFVDVPMIDGQLSLLTYHASAWLNAGREPSRIGNAHPSIHPFCAYATRDGFINLAIGNDRLWASFCEVAGLALASDPRFLTNRDRVERRHELDALLAPVMAGQDTAAWLAALGEAGVPAGPMATVPEALARASLVSHAHPETGGEIRTVALPYRLDDAPRAAERRAPRLGEHGDEVRADWCKIAADAPETPTPKTSS